MYFQDTAECVLSMYACVWTYVLSMHVCASIFMHACEGMMVNEQMIGMSVYVSSHVYVCSVCVK